MVVFGLVLLVLALAVLAYMWMATRGMDAAQISYGFLNIDVTPFWMFLAGGITLAVATCALWLIAVGSRRRARKAKEVRELRKQVGDRHTGGTTGTGTSTKGRDTATTRGASTGTATGSGSTPPPAPASDQPILPRQGSRASGAPGTGSGATSATNPRPNSLDVDR